MKIEKLLKQEIIKNSDDTINTVVTIYQKGIRTFDIVTEYFEKNKLDEWQTDRHYSYNEAIVDFNTTVDYRQKEVA